MWIGELSKVSARLVVCWLACLWGRRAERGKNWWRDANGRSGGGGRKVRKGKKEEGSLRVREKYAL